MLLRGIERISDGTTDGHAEALMRSVCVLEAVHSTHLGKRSDLLITVAIEVLLSVVYGHASVDTIGQSCILHDGHALV
jgi:hypothetical protein